MKRLVALVFPAIALAACGGSVSIDGHACPCADGFVCCAGTSTCAAAGAACPGGVAPTAENVRALCAARAAGPIGPPATAQAFARVMSRRWISCSPEPGSTLPIHACEGIELTNDGKWYFLRQTPSGYERDPDPASTGAYELSNSTLWATTGQGNVGPSDTTFAKLLLFEWHYKPTSNYELTVDFEHAPLRFHTFNFGDVHFVALDDDGEQYVGSEGMTCDEAGTICRGPTRCVTENNSGACAAPAIVGFGEGCDHKGTRTCDPMQKLACQGTRRCARVHGAAEACNGITDVCDTSLACNAGYCTAAM